MRRAPGRVLLSVVGLFGAAGTSGAAPPNVSFRWTIPGAAAPSRLVAVDGRAFVLMRGGDDLVVVDVARRTGGGTGAAHPSLRVPGRLSDLAYARSRTLDPAASLHVDREVLYLAGSANDGELAVALATRGRPLALEAVHDLPGPANALSVATDGTRLFVGRARSREPELVVLDLEGAILGSLDLGQPIVALELEGDLLRASSKRLTFVVDVRDPTAPSLVDTTPRDPAASPPLAVPRTVDHARDGPFAYLAVRARSEEIQQVNLRLPVRFADLDGDGLRTLACAGDSNTTDQPARNGWCELLAELVADPSFAIRNLAVAGATAIPSPTSAYQQVAAALDPAVAADAVVLAFGTNDTNLVHFDPDPARFDEQLDAIADHLEAHYVAIESTGRRAYVATAPPRFRALFSEQGYNERIVGLNERILARFPADAVIEHYDFFPPTPEYFSDGTHATQRAQELRALRALEALTR